MSVEGEGDGDDEEDARAEEPRERRALTHDRAPAIIRQRTILLYKLA